MNDYPRRTFIRNSLLTAAGLAVSKYLFGQPPKDYTYMSIAEVSEMLRQRKVSPVDLTIACLKRIELLNPKLNAFITITANSALKEAKQAETEIRNGNWKGPMHGIPIAYKDNIDTAGVRTTAASAIFKDRVPKEDAEVVKKLKNAGAISLGKLNLHEFALGTTSVISNYGSVHNPWNLDYIAGGSSGGSAVAVAAGLCYASIGTDTGGSSRLPPACCGITGLKATYGLISIKGIIPVIQSVDHACPICRSVEDTAIMLNVLADQPTGKNNSVTDYCKSFGEIKNPQIGIIKNYKASEEVETIFNNAIKSFLSLGCKTVNVEFPRMTVGSSIYAPEIEAYHRPLISKFSDKYDIITLNDINFENKTTAVDYINAKYKMEEDRNTISSILFKNCEVVVLPTTTAVTPTIKEAKANGPFALDPYNTEPFNYFGLPAINIPCGFSKNGLPLGLQIVGPALGERQVLNVANRYQKANNWHLKHPNFT